MRKAQKGKEQNFKQPKDRSEGKAMMEVKKSRKEGSRKSEWSLTSFAYRSQIVWIPP